MQDGSICARGVRGDFQAEDLQKNFLAQTQLMSFTWKVDPIMWLMLEN